MTAIPSSTGIGSPNSDALRTSAPSSSRSSPASPSVNASPFNSRQASSQRRQASAQTRQCGMWACRSHSSPQLLQMATQASSSGLVTAAAYRPDFGEVATGGESVEFYVRYTELMREAYTACWWVPAGHRPTRVALAALLLAAIAMAGDSLQIDSGLPAASVNVLMAIVLLVVLGANLRSRKAAA